MTALMLVSALGLFAALYVLAPVGGRAGQEEEGRIGLQDAAERKGAALTALLDIEEEHEVGKLATPDYGDLRDLYTREAWEAIEELDRGRVAAIGDEDLEREVSAMRAHLSCAACGSLRAKDGGCPACGDGP